jgi:antitoxin component YwqK of YwqJK toxin-antitoxin module
LKTITLIFIICTATLLNAQLGYIETLTEDYDKAVYEVVKKVDYKGDRAFHRWCFVSDTNLLAAKFTTLNGNIIGMLEVYHPDGYLFQQQVFGYGLPNGRYLELNQKGEMVVLGSYRNGKKNGKWVFFDAGVKGKYYNGLKSGRWKYYYKGSLVLTRIYRKGSLKKQERPKRASSW